MPTPGHAQPGQQTKRTGPPTHTHWRRAAHRGIELDHLVSAQRQLVVIGGYVVPDDPGPALQRPEQRRCGEQGVRGCGSEPASEHFAAQPRPRSPPAQGLRTSGGRSRRSCQSMPGRSTRSARAPDTTNRHKGTRENGSQPDQIATTTSTAGWPTDPAAAAAARAMERVAFLSRSMRAARGLVSTPCRALQLQLQPQSPPLTRRPLFLFC